MQPLITPLYRTHADGLVLASASPRRRELLASLGLEFAVIASAIPEDELPGETPDQHVRRLSRAKAREVATQPTCPGRWVLASDTIVVRDGRLLGKPGSAAEARAMLSSLADRWHEVLSGFALIDRTDGREHCAAVLTRVSFRRLTAAEIAGYIASGEPFDKAGGYGIQGLAACMARAIDGSYTNVVGLPLCEVVETLLQAGTISPG